jgi:pyruvate dehydrogenase E2 component (dihydrolipoamide acetyltransferase)
MAIEVVMPRLGWNMEKGVLAEWLRRDGDPVKPGDVLFTVETDKALNEVEAMDAGVLRIPPNAPTLGAELPVGALLAYIVQPGEEAPFERLAAPSLAQMVESASPHLTERTHVPTELPKTGKPTISPRARRFAIELGVDWTHLQGSGRTGRIVERDVRAAAIQGTHTDTQPWRGTAFAGEPITSVRRVIARRLAHSAHTAAPVTLTTDADATELVRLRQRTSSALTGGGQIIPSYNDFFARLTALALLEHPAMNASLEGDNLVRHGVVHIGIAVDTERGLLVPVVRDAHTKSVQKIATESARLIAQARNGDSRPEDLRGGTFTLSNLGMYAIDAFTPIINLPECAILGIGRIVARPVVVDEHTEQIAVRKMVALSLTFDHRVVDGAPAARFLSLVKQYVEEPALWLLA